LALNKPRGRLKRALSLPVVMDRHGLGWMLGSRFIIIEHEGRRSGRIYRTPVEVVAHHIEPLSWTVVAAWGDPPQWFANLQHRDARAVVVAGRRYDAPVQQIVDADEANDLLVAYAFGHPLVARLLFRVLSWPAPRQPGAFRQIAESVPLIRFTARSQA